MKENPQKQTLRTWCVDYINKKGNGQIFIASFEEKYQARRFIKDMEGKAIVLTPNPYLKEHEL